MSDARRPGARRPSRTRLPAPHLVSDRPAANRDAGKADVHTRTGEMMDQVQFQVGSKTLTIETGRLARQSNGAALVTCDGASVLVTVNTAKPREGIDFFPLTVDYEEKMYAAGKLPGGFFKREGRQGEKEILTSRFIDRALRPLFPDGFRDDTQVIATVLSVDDEEDPDMLAFIGASAAVCLSEAPFPGPLGAVRVGRVDGRFVVNPNYEEQERSDLTLIMAAGKDALVMVEGGAKQAPERDVLAALRFGFDAIQPMIEAQAALVRRAGKAKKPIPPPAIDPALRQRIDSASRAGFERALAISEKHARYEASDAVEHEVLAAITAEHKSRPMSFATLADFEAAQAAGRKLVADARAVLEATKSDVMRQRILSGQPRNDGRSSTEIRPIQCEVNVLGRVHGSALFTRGETQALVAVTLGGADDEQMIDGLRPKHFRRFMLHYNFPPYSVGEVRPLRGPSRRDTGHGALADRAIKAVMPSDDECPYVVRIVSEVLESNGSSSMATVCGSSLALMHAGIKIQSPVAGIAMGLISEKGRYAVLSDILGDEDHLGDMDFKVAGTREGITAIQMDLKIEGLDWEILQKALEQARVGRLHILDRMAAETRDALPNFAAREELSATAPRLEVIWIKPDRIRDLIGPGGRVIRAIQSSTNSKVDIEDNGKVTLLCPNLESLRKCKAMVEELTQEAEIGRFYRGKVKKVTDFGAFVEIFPGTDGLLHISEMADRRVEKVSDICVEGDDVLVKCIDIDPSGRIRLSRKQALAEGAAAQA
jgi:polyribonucleotide nucleotidyltransferase